MAASAKRASWSVTGLRGSSPNAIAICSRRRSSACSRIRRTTACISPSPAAGGCAANTISRRRKSGWRSSVRDGGRHDPGQVLRRAPGPPVQVGQVGEEAIGAAFHDGEQDPVLGAEVVVDGAHRDAGFGHHAGQRRGFEAVLGHDPLGRVQHEFTGPHAPAVGRHFSAYCHGSRIAQVLELTLQFYYCSVHSSSREGGAMPFTAGADEEVPVLIVGGGGAGLTSSMLLARLGVEHLLVSARPGTSDLPKAHVLNQRAMEVLDDVGVAGAIARARHAAGADGGDGVLRGPGRSRPGLRAPPGPAGELGRRRGGRELAGGEPVAAAEPAADPPRAAAEGPGGGALARPDPLRPRADRPRAGRRGRAGRDPRQRLRPPLRGALPVPARRGRGAAGGQPDRRRVRGARRGDADRDAARVRRLLALGEGSGRADPLDLLAAGRRAGGDGPDGAAAVGPAVRGVGDPPELPGR